MTRKSRKSQIATYAGLAVVFIALVFFLLRGPYLSNYIKRLFIPQLENLTRERILIEKAVINLFPFYVQAKGFKVFDKHGNRLLWVTKMRAYIDVLGLLSNQLKISKLTMKEPDLSVSQDDITRIANNIKKSLSIGEGKKLKVVLNGIILVDGNLKYTDGRKIKEISGSGLRLSMFRSGKSYELDGKVEDLNLMLTGLKRLSGSVELKSKINEEKLAVSRFHVTSGKSSIETSGDAVLLPAGRVSRGTFKLKSRLDLSMLDSFFEIKKPHEGFINLQGKVELSKDDKSPWPAISLDLETDSEFDLETLMEMVHVNKNIKGHIKLKGKVSGTIPDVRGRGEVKLLNAEFDRLPVDNLEGVLSYSNKRFDFESFEASIYSGNITGQAHITLPHGEYFVDGVVTGINSPQFFSFIKWHPPFPGGVISGSFNLEKYHQQMLAVTADVTYQNKHMTDGNFFDRLEKVSTRLQLKDGILQLSDAVMSTGLSQLWLDGVIDLKHDTLDLTLGIDSRDVSEFTSPYYTKLIASGQFRGTAYGLIKDPTISGNIELYSGSVYGIGFDKALATLDYRINLLDIHKVHVQQTGSSIDGSGSIKFRNTRKLFSFRNPFFNGKVKVNGVLAGQFARLIHENLPFEGKGDGYLSFRGDFRKFRGEMDMRFSDVSLYDQELDSIDIKAELDPSEVKLKDVRAEKHKSVVTGSGKISYKGEFDINLFSNLLYLDDVSAFKSYPLKAKTRLRVTGKGTLDDPAIIFSLAIKDGIYDRIKFGNGDIHGKIKGKRLTAESSIADGMITSKFNAQLDKDHQWNLSVKFHNGEYNFLVSAFTDILPDDFSLWGAGSLWCEFKQNRLNMHSEINALNVSLYDYSFHNKENIVFDFDNDIFDIKSFEFTGRDSSFSADGRIKLNEWYDVAVKGDINVSPLRIFYDELMFLEGRSDFDITIRGKWDKPEIMGTLNVNNVTAALSSVKNSIGPVNGTFQLKKDRITFDSVKAEIMSGIMLFSGTGRLDNFSLKRFNVSSIMDEIKLRSIKDIRADIDGELYYEYTPGNSRLTGSIFLSRASYRRDVIWKNWLSGIRSANRISADYPEWLKETEFNLQVIGADDVWIDNDIAKAPVSLDLNIIGTLDRLGMVGSVASDRGFIYFRGNEFRILEGSTIDFTDSARIHPFFHINAKTFRDNYFIRLTLDGTLDRFSLSLSSDPPLSESEILTLLTFGHLGKGTKGISGGIAAGEATSLLTGGIQENIRDELKNITGIERFEVQPHITSSGSLTSKVTLGKRLLEDRISVIYSTTIGTTEEQIIQIEYRLSDEISIVGSRNEIGSAGADIKYEFLFK